MADDMHAAELTSRSRSRFRATISRRGFGDVINRIVGRSARLPPPALAASNVDRVRGQHFCTSYCTIWPRSQTGGSRRAPSFLEVSTASTLTATRWSTSRSACAANRLSARPRRRRDLRPLESRAAVPQSRAAKRKTDLGRDPIMDLSPTPVYAPCLSPDLTVDLTD